MRPSDKKVETVALVQSAFKVAFCRNLPSTKYLRKKVNFQHEVIAFDTSLYGRLNKDQKICMGL